MANFKSMRPLVGVPAPFLYALAFLVGLALDRFVPWHPAWLHAFRPLGWMLVVIGVLISPLSAALLGWKRTTLNPLGKPSHLVVSGWYKITRNPMYLGLAIAYVGLCVAMGRLWPVFILAAPLVFLDRVVVPFEEQQLQATFGRDFSRYCGRVRRWL